MWVNVLFRTSFCLSSRQAKINFLNEDFFFWFLQDDFVVVLKDVTYCHKNSFNLIGKQIINVVLKLDVLIALAIETV